MTLRRRMALHTGVMIVGVVLIGLGTIWGITGLRQDLGVALDANARLRGAYEVGTQLTTARRWLRIETHSISRASTALRAAAVKLDEHMSNDARLPNPTIASIRDTIHIADDELPSDPAAAVRSIDMALADLARFSADARQTIVSRQQAADAKHHATLVFVAALSAIVVVLTIVVGLGQYRSVLRPLGRLTDAVRRMAAGKLDERLPSKGDAEFIQLTDSFNHMAGELHDLYQSLEQRVAQKSKELVRSERLASVGYLAAGVAHEINNPLAIIAGYGERSLHHLKRNDGSPIDSATTDRIEAALRVICDEAFRAKDITDRLLSLARPITEARATLDFAALAREVAGTLAGLSKFSDRKLVVTNSDSARTLVTGSGGELKQVMVNLLVNALEAAPGGEVRVDVTGDGSVVELTVTDNGRGMSTETLDRVFEPFFTERRSDRPAGTGLGLSIAHAIVTDHGGFIRAESNGVGQGSRFTVSLPTAAHATSLPVIESNRS